MADTAAALVIQLSADFKDFKKQMQQATGVFDSEGKKIAKRQEDLKKKLSDWSLDFTGLSGLNKALVGLTAAGIGVGLADLLRKSLDAAAAIGDTAKSAGVSVEFLQKLRFAASQSGTTFDTMDVALTTLNKNLGEFVNTGAGKAAQTFKTLGIDKLISKGDVRDAEDLFNVLVKKLQGFSSEAQKSAFLASAFGKEAGPQLLQLMNQGADGIAKLEAQAVSLGIVLSKATVEGATDAKNKLDALFNVMKAEGIAAVGNLAPEIAKLAQAITDGLPDLILWVEKWAAYFHLIDLTPVQKLQLQIKDVKSQIESADSLKDSSWLNPVGIMSMNIDAGKAALISKLQGLQADIDHAMGMAKTTRGHHAHPGDDLNLEWKGGQFDQPALKINDIAAQAKAEADAKAAEERRLRQERFMAGVVADATTSGAALQAAQNATQVQLLVGSMDYAKAVRKQIDDEFQQKSEIAEAETGKQLAELDKQKLNATDHATAIAAINATLLSKISAAAAERQSKLDNATSGGFLRNSGIQAQEQIRQYQDEANAIGLTAGAAAKLAFIQGQLNDAKRAGIILTKEEIAGIEAQGEAIGQAAQKTDTANKLLDRSIQVQDEVRGGLIDVGAAGLQGFDNMADAARNFIAQLAEMILRLGVLKPLVEGLLGAEGTSGGGFLSGFGGVIGKLFGAGNDLASLTTSAIAANPLLFAGGGPTPPGAKNKPVGIVHAGENVWSQDDVRRAGGMAAVEAMRRGMGGYADGGAVGTPVQVLPALTQADHQRRGGPSLSIFVDARYATKGTEELIREELVRSYPTLVKAAVQESNRQFPANLSNTLTNRA
jgi:hypothetical protein